MEKEHTTKQLKFLTRKFLIKTINNKIIFFGLENGNKSKFSQQTSREKERENIESKTEIIN